MYDVIDVVPEIDNPRTNHKLKKFFSSDEKNPVTAICACNGYLLAAIGTKIIMYAMEEGDLNGVAFLDVNIFVVSLSAIKNVISVSDLYKSVWFVAFQEDPAKLVLLGKDLYPIELFGSEFLVGDDELAIVISDSLKNIHVLTYEPLTVQSQGGQRLLRRGEINLGYEIQSFVRLRLKPEVAAGKLLLSKKMGLLAGTVSGGISIHIPVSEKIFRRLYCLYSRMVTHTEHYCGLNPRGFRYFILNKAN